MYEEPGTAAETIYRLDVFIGHAWRSHQEWLDVVSFFDAIEKLTWRNFSVPWHDPALHHSRELDYGLLTTTYKSQIMPVNIFLLITDLLSSNGNKRWLSLGLDFAEELKVPIYALRSEQSAHYKDFEERCIQTLPMTMASIEEIASRHCIEAEFRFV